MSAPQLSGKYQVVAHVTINANQHNVWEVLEDFANVYTWAPGVEKSHALGKPELGVGAGRYCKLDGFGEIEEYITQFNSGTGFVYDVTALGPLHEAFSCWWLTKVTNHQTRLTVTFSYNIRFGLVGWLMHSLMMRSKLEKSLPETLAAVKKRVETGALVRPIVA